MVNGRLGKLEFPAYHLIHTWVNPSIRQMKLPRQRLHVKKPLSVKPERVAVNHHLNSKGSSSSLHPLIYIYLFWIFKLYSNLKYISCEYRNLFPPSLIGLHLPHSTCQPTKDGYRARVCSFYPNKNWWSRPPRYPRFQNSAPHSDMSTSRLLV